MNQIRLKAIILVFTVGILITSCSNLQFIPPSLPDFSQAYSITIGDYWDGLPSPTTPLNSFYAVESSDDHFEGAALFSVGGSGGDQKPLQATAIINIPNEIVQSFLKKLADVRLIRGQYQPYIEHTDDFPSIVIRLVYGNAEAIEFYTSSQGDEHIPWQVTYKGQSYIVNSGIPAQALEILKPYLSQDVLQNLIGQAHW